jgi:hypothetical protein
MKEIFARWRYRRNWRILVFMMRRFAMLGNIHALAELRRLKADPDPRREEGLRVAAVCRVRFSDPAIQVRQHGACVIVANKDYDQTKVIGVAELDQFVKVKLDTWRDGYWHGKKSCPELTLEGLFSRPSQ